MIESNMIFLRVYLLAGLIAHKVLWEVLKRRGQAGNASTRGQLALSVRLVKLVKLSILGGILIQTMIPDDWITPLLMAEDPKLLRMVGTLVYSAGLCIAMLGRLQLGGNWDDIETATVLDRQSVVSIGLYKFIRHPIYVGDLIMLVGLELALNNWLVIGVVLLAPIVLAQAVGEEKMLVKNLAGYESYCKQTKRFIPYVF